MRLVVAEDQGLVRDALVQLLSVEPDVTVIGQARNGRDAVTLAALGPDIVLMDIEMPDLNGIEACRQIRGQYPAVRVVILTTFGRTTYLRQALDAGAVGFLLKDDPVSILVQKLRQVMAGERVIEPSLAISAIFDNDNPLTDREVDILRAAADGQPISAIARQLHLSEGTIRNHLSVIIQKLQVTNRMQAVKKAEHLGWI